MRTWAWIELYARRMRRIHPHFYYFRKMANVIELTCPDRSSCTLYSTLAQSVVQTTDTSFTYELQILVQQKKNFYIVNAAAVACAVAATVAVAILNPTPILIRIVRVMSILIFDARFEISHKSFVWWFFRVHSIVRFSLLLLFGK